MKNTLLLAVCCFFGMQTAFAQDTIVESVTVSEVTVKRENPFNFYVGFGAAFLGDFNLNEKLKQSEMPQIGNAAPEFTFGFNFTEPDSKIYMDIEATAAARIDKSEGYQVNTVASAAKMRIHYRFLSNNKWFLSAGGDVSYGINYVNLFSRNNAIDLNDLNPGMHTGHISMYNQQLMVGPSVAVGLFQDMVFPIRINFGYDIALTNGKWKSEYASINNTVKENGFDRFYVKVSIGF